MKLNLEFKRRRTPTLIAWWRELNSWRWPKDIPDPEPPDAPDNPHRNRVMADHRTRAWTAHDLCTEFVTPKERDMSTAELIDALNAMLPWFDYGIEMTKRNPGGYAETLLKHRATVVAAVNHLQAQDASHWLAPSGHIHKLSTPS